MKDMVNKPNHYQLFADGTEAIDVIEMALTFDEYVGYLKGNALKYRLRAGKKDMLHQEIAKAENYEARLTKLLEDEGTIQTKLESIKTAITNGRYDSTWGRPPQVEPTSHEITIPTERTGIKTSVTWGRPPQVEPTGEVSDDIPYGAKEYCGPCADCSKCPEPCK